VLGPYTLDLSSARAKYVRARRLTLDFQDSVEQKLGKHPILYPLTRRYEASESAIVYRIERSIEADDWSLIVADAVHNFRCALDHLAWQLALRHFGDEAKAVKHRHGIRFPFDFTGAAWPQNRYTKYMLPADAAKLTVDQPFNVNAAAASAKLPHPLAMLCDLSNTDKHQRLQLTYAHASAYSFPPPGIVNARDCRVSGGIRLGAFPVSPKTGDIAILVPVTVTGPDPDVELAINLSCFIAVRDHWNVEDVLTMIGQSVDSILNHF